VTPPEPLPEAVPEVGHTRLTVLAGPTAVGKGSVSADIRAHHPEVWISVSATTRAPRPGEQDGVHYWFVSEAEFDRMVADGEFLEWAVVHGMTERVELLVDHGSDIQARFRDGLTAYETAARNGDGALVAVLESRGAVENGVSVLRPDGEDDGIGHGDPP
jgi:ribose 1,5-bisphosphokinase PhnN